MSEEVKTFDPAGVRLRRPDPGIWLRRKQRAPRRTKTWPAWSYKPILHTALGKVGELALHMPIEVAILEVAKADGLLVCQLTWLWNALVEGVVTKRPTKRDFLVERLDRSKTP